MYVGSLFRKVKLEKKNTILKAWKIKKYIYIKRNKWKYLQKTAYVKKELKLKGRRIE